MRITIGLLLALILTPGLGRASTSRDVPILREAALPTYPPIGMAAHLIGKVTVRVTIKNGLVTKTDIVSKPDQTALQVLETATATSLRTWRFDNNVNTTLTVSYFYQIVGPETEQPTNPEVEMLPSLDVKITAHPVKPTVNY